MLYYVLWLHGSKLYKLAGSLLMYYVVVNCHDWDKHKVTYEITGKLLFISTVNGSTK